MRMPHYFNQWPLTIILEITLSVSALLIIPWLLTLNRKLHLFGMPTRPEWVSVSFLGSPMTWAPYWNSEKLGFLADEFSNLEIKAIIKDMPNNHAPRPDGFNGFFIKRCWSIIKEDFIRVIKDFHGISIDINCLNMSHITLIPKNPTQHVWIIIDLSLCSTTLS